MSNSAPNGSALQRWGINMQPIDPSGRTNPTTNPTTNTAASTAAAGPFGHDMSYPSTPGGARRRAEVAMSVIHGMAALGDSIADRSAAGSSSRGGGGGVGNMGSRSAGSRLSFQP
jgi:hypothetical protein